jgi:hypothetical protein
MFCKGYFMNIKSMYSESKTTGLLIKSYVINFHNDIHSQTDFIFIKNGFNILIVSFILFYSNY